MNLKTNIVALLIAMLLSACASQAPNYGGTWQPLNTFSTQIQEIPLTRPYRFYVLPIDRTLKALLTRWASDNTSTIDYQSPLDFSLPQQTATINTTNPVDAIAQLNTIYQSKHILITREFDGHITVSSQPTTLVKKP